MLLLWNFPSWETMFVARDHASIPGGLVLLFAVTNITQGILGYYVVWRLLRAGRTKLAFAQTIWSHLMMLLILYVGWDGSGFKRFTYTGTWDEFQQVIEYSWTLFFGSPVFWTLIGLGVVFIPSYLGVIYLNAQEGNKS